MVAELVLVFVGVTAAFVVDNYREEAQKRRRAAQLAAALYRDVTSFATARGQYIAGIRTGLQDFAEARKAGRRPVPFVQRVPGAEGAPVEVWAAAMQSGAGEVLDPELVLDLATLDHEIDGDTSVYMRYAEFTERRVWPVSNARPARRASA